MTAIPERWMEALRRAELGVAPPLLERLGAASEERTLAAGERLVRQGDVADSLFLVIDGKLVVTLEPDGQPLQELGAGDIVGEMAILLGGRRSATVRATEPASLLGLTRERLGALVVEAPDLVAAFSRALEDRLRRAKIATWLRRTFGEVGMATLRDVERRVTWVNLAAGDELFKKGDPPDGAYILVVGRLRVVLDERVIDEVGPSEWVGEMALLTRNPRSATVYAARDSELVFLSNEVFDDLGMKHPRLLLETSKVLVQRLQRHMTAAGPARATTRTFALVPLGDGVDTSWLVKELTRALSTHGTLLHLTAARVDERLGKAGIANTACEGPLHVQLSGWLMEQERAHDLVLYEADARSEWADRAIRQADHVLFVAKASGSPRITEAERGLTAHDASSRLPHASLILMQSGAHHHSYPGTRAWVAPRKLHGHHHVRPQRASDVERIARLLTGNAVGVVFGGGASRGYAHLGVVRALQEVGVHVDATGGSSIGAVVALATAGELPWREQLEVIPPLMRSAFFDPTLPVVSLMRGFHTLEAVNKALGGAVEIEDLVTPMFAVSTNLTRGGVVVHRTGPLDVAIRASGSVPGIFPPVPWNGNLLVDGGLSNNVPADVMMSLFGERVIAVDVMPDVDIPVHGELPAAVSGWSVAWRKLNPLAKSVGLPNILTTLMRSAMMSTRGLQSVDPVTYPHLLYLKPPVSRWNLMDFRNAEPVADEGYRATVDAIRAWWAREQR